MELMTSEELDARIGNVIAFTHVANVSTSDVERTVRALNERDAARRALVAAYRDVLATVDAQRDELRAVRLERDAACAQLAEIRHAVRVLWAAEMEASDDAA